MPLCDKRCACTKYTRSIDTRCASVSVVFLPHHRPGCICRHRCIIDLQENCLRIGSTGHSSRFLTEAEIPKKDLLQPVPKEEGGSGGAAAASRFPEGMIQTLMSTVTSMGLGKLSRDEVVEALTVTDGNPDDAVAYLIQQLSGMS